MSPETTLVGKGSLFCVPDIDVTVVVRLSWGAEFPALPWYLLKELRGFHNE
jgi:hypothetical protein